jgi:hypothetical protein
MTSKTDETTTDLSTDWEYVVLRTFDPGTLEREMNELRVVGGLLEAMAVATGEKTIFIATFRAPAGTRQKREEAAQVNLRAWGSIDHD